MSTEHSISDRKYVVIWGVLLAALAVSLAIGSLGHTGLSVAMIFTIALVKAYLVAARFMHLSLEPRWVNLIVVGALLVVVILFFGLVPDVMWVFGRKTGT